MPFLSWSTQTNDLRPAHLTGLHALQIIPVVGYGVTRARAKLPAGRQVGYLVSFAFVYTAVGVLLFWQAIQGKPLIAL